MGKILSCICKVSFDTLQTERCIQEEPQAERELLQKNSDLHEASHPLLPTEENPPHGLRNQGATCYLNSVLQLLFMTPEVHKALEKNPNQTDTDVVLKNLFEELKKGPCGTETMTRHLDITEHMQRDAAEYLELLLNHLSPDVSEPFRGNITEKTQCCEGHCVHEETSLFWTVPLPLEHISGRTVQDAFQATFQQTSLSDVYCEECQKKTEAKCSSELTKPPQILLLLLKRFDVNPSTGYYCKSECEVELSATLLLKTHSYSLCGVVHHWGSVRGGHYTTTFLSAQNHNWYDFNDTTVDKVSAPTGQRSQSAFVLVYRRNFRTNSRCAPHRSSKKTLSDLRV